MKSLYLYIGLGLLGIATLAATGAAYYYYRLYRDGLDERFDELFEEEDGALSFDPPSMTRSPLDYLRVMRHYQRASKLAKRGYVRWYRLGSTMSRPKWVKPEQEGTGVPKYDDGGQPYYFPKEAMVSDSLTGAWTAIHREGEADPINLRDPAYPGIETDLVERIINLEAEDKPPGLLDSLTGLSTQAMIYGGMALMFVVYAGFRYMNGGF